MSVRQTNDLQAAQGSGGVYQASIPVTVTNPSGQGALTTVPAGTTNGAPLGTMPAGSIGARFYLGSSDSITFAIASSQPSSAPSPTVTISGANGQGWDEPLGLGAMIYVTAITGSPVFRWI